MSEPEAQAVLPHEQPLPPRTDLVTAAVLFAAGVAIIYAAWRMPRFQEQLGQIYTAPGLVPALYGFVIVILALWLAARAIGRGALEPAAGTASRAPREGHSNARLVLAIVLCLAFAVGMVGRLPFWLATAIFVFLFILLFEWRGGRPWRERIRPIITAAIVAGITGVLVVLVFQRVFYVRLP
jgi:putative tricarboxylic transport membrane protein